MPKHEVVSITPAIIDVACDLTKREKVYTELRTLLHSGPGEWISVDDRKMFEELLGLVAGTFMFNLDEDVDALGSIPDVRIEAGSTGLNLLSALSRSQRENSAMVSAVGTNSSGTPDTLATMFAHDAGRASIYQYTLPTQGCTPVALVFSHRDEPKKVTAMHPGVAAQVELLPRAVKTSRIVHIDAHDLLRPPAFSTLGKLIKEGRLPVALSLSNPSILQGQLKETIKEYLAERKVTYLMGNAEEIGLLVSSDPIVSLEHALQLGVGKLAPYVLVTLGSRGLLGFDHNKPKFQRSFLHKRPINTSGAGDTAAGVFLSGILSGQDFALTLKEAAYYSSQIVDSRASRFISGREQYYKNDHADSGHTITVE